MAASSYGTVKTLRGFLRGWTGYSDDEELPSSETKSAPAANGTVRALQQAAGTSKGYDSSADAVKTLNNAGSPDAVVDLDERCLVCAGKARDSYSPDSQQEYPLLVVSACYLPPSPTEHHVRQLFQRLDELTGEPYLMVLFATPSPAISVKQLIAYYRALSDDARRNVRRLHICHPGLLTRLAVKLFLNTIVSGKVAQKGKVKLIPTLSLLAKELDVTK
jgi:hypothetical protein